MKQSLVSYTCDAPACAVTTLDGSDFDPPHAWWTLTPPDVAVYDDKGQLHFCSHTCLFAWMLSDAGLPKETT